MKYECGSCNDCASLTEILCVSVTHHYVWLIRVKVNEVIELPIYDDSAEVGNYKTDEIKPKESLVSVACKFNVLFAQGNAEIGLKQTSKCSVFIHYFAQK